MKRLEQGLQRSLVAQTRWRGAPGTFVFHVPNGGWRSSVEGAIFKSLGVVAGLPDLGFIDGSGRIFWIECKSPKGHLSPAQIATHAALRAAGCEVATVSSVDAALAQIAAWGIKLRGSVQ